MKEFRPMKYDDELKVIYNGKNAMEIIKNGRLRWAEHAMIS